MFLFPNCNKMVAFCHTGLSSNVFVEFLTLYFFVLQRFIQYLASRNTLFNLSNFLDKSGLQGKYMLSAPTVLSHLL